MSAVNKNEVAAYSKLIRPSTNRVNHWHYFGFPADDRNTILSREHIICIVCKAAFCYNNKITDALKTHLKRKHPDVTKLLAATTGQPAKDQPVPTRSNSSVATYSDADYLLDSMTEAGQGADEQEMIEYLLPDETMDDEMKEVLSPKTECISNDMSTQRNNAVVSVGGNNTNNYNDQIVEMCILDLLPASVAEGSGFSRLLLAIDKNVAVPNIQTIKKTMQQFYRIEKKTQKVSLRTALKNNPFSLLIDKWTNFEQTTYLTISVCYTTASQVMQTAYWLTISSPNTVDELTQHLIELDVQLCTAVVVNFDVCEELALQEFLTTNAIPVVECFSEIIRRTASRCFAHPDVHDIIDRITKFLAENTKLVSKSWPEPPVIHSYLWMTSYSYLEYFQDFYYTIFDTADSRINEMLVQIKSILECLSPFKVALETISNEAKPLASLIKPLTQQLLVNHFTLDRADNSIVTAFKNIVIEEFGVSIVNRQFLSIASFLDPRFQNLTLPKDLVAIKKEVQKFYLPSADEKTVIATLSGGGSQRKAASGLSFFFNNRDSVPAKKTRDRFDVEFDGYHADAAAELEQCPLAWWTDHCVTYPGLKVVANRFCCVPAVVQSTTVPLSQQILLFNNRKTLSSTRNIDIPLFLHYNRQRQIAAQPVS